MTEWLIFILLVLAVVYFGYFRVLSYVEDVTAPRRADDNASEPFFERQEPKAYRTGSLQDRKWPPALKGTKGKRQTIVGRGLMRRGEQQCFRLLCEALPDYHVCPQVSFNALVTHSDHVFGTYINKVRSRFNWRYVDFVICERTSLDVFAIVEFDGTGHDPKDDAERDAMLVAAGYRVERFTQDTLDSIKARFADLVPKSSAEVGVSSTTSAEGFESSFVVSQDGLPTARPDSQA